MSVIEVKDFDEAAAELYKLLRVLEEEKMVRASDAMREAWLAAEHVVDLLSGEG